MAVTPRENADIEVAGPDVGDALVDGSGVVGRERLHRNVLDAKPLQRPADLFAALPQVAIRRGDEHPDPRSRHLDALLSRPAFQRQALAWHLPTVT
jgi:hypothetical protein